MICAAPNVYHRDVSCFFRRKVSVMPAQSLTEEALAAHRQAHTHAAEIGAPVQVDGIAKISDPELGVLLSSALFTGVERDEAIAMLGCLRALRKEFDAGEMVLRTGDRGGTMGLVLSGQVTIEKVDAWGSRSIIAAARAGDTFAEAFACSGAAQLPVSVVASQPSVVLLLDVDHVLSLCSSACVFHAKLVRNLLRSVARQSLELSHKVDAITPRTIRKRILAYLDAQAQASGSRRFTVPLNRQQMADYLCVDRSALCHELAKMRAEGIIDFDHNNFMLQEMCRV
jgi:CRP-like cAMP-binding protein